ncbi:MAG: serine protease, partial [Actinomycetota bacterium]|nr:serine protease [Actinomycetota bacterium]
MSPNKDTSGGAHRLAPRPVSRPPVDPQATRTFGRPRGVEGSFVAEELRPAAFRNSEEFTPGKKAADPVLEE